MSLTREMPEGALLVTDGQGVYVGEYVKKGSQGRNRKTFDGPWVNLFQRRLLELATDEQLNAADFRVMLALLARATHESPVFPSSPTEIAAELGLNVSTVTRAMAKLAAKGVIDRPSKGRVALNAHVAWRGSAEARMKWLKEREIAGRSTENAPDSSAPR